MTDKFTKDIAAAVATLREQGAPLTVDTVFAHMKATHPPNTYKGAIIFVRVKISEALGIRRVFTAL